MHPAPTKTTAEPTATPHVKPIETLTEDDVLRVDPVHEYDVRLELREASESRLEETGDDTDEVVERGRPTGP